MNVENYKDEDEFVKDQKKSNIDYVGKDLEIEQMETTLTEMLPQLEELEYPQQNSQIEDIFRLILEISEKDPNYNFFNILSPSIYQRIFDFTNEEKNNSIIALGSSFLLRSLGRDMNESQMNDFYDNSHDLLNNFIPHIINESKDALLISNVFSLGNELQYKLNLSFDFDISAIFSFFQRFGIDFIVETENIGLLLQRSFLFFTYFIQNKTLGQELTKIIFNIITENLFPILSNIDNQNVRVTFIELIKTIIARNFREDPVNKDNIINSFDWISFFNTHIVEQLFLKWIEKYKDYYATFMICELIWEPHFPVLIDNSFFFTLLKNSEKPDLTKTILSNELYFLKEDNSFITSFIENDYTKVLLDEAQNYDFNNKKIAILIFSEILSSAPDSIEQGLFKDILCFSLDCFSYDEQLDYELFNMLLDLLEKKDLNEEYREIVLNELFESHTEVMDAINEYDKNEDENTKSIAYNLKKIIDTIKGENAEGNEQQI